MANIWRFRGDEGTGKAFPQAVIDAADGSPLLARLLANRGLMEPAEIRAFLDMDAYQPTSAKELPDIDVAIERLVKAIDNKEAILIYGDFDVDGITGTSVLYETLKTRLDARVSYYIPDRATEGHGLHSAALVRLTSTRQIKLVITTDTGITNFSEVSLLNGLGIDTIVTDHHALPENLPPAIANVNPQRLLIDNPGHPLGQMCGAGVSYKVSELLLAHYLPTAEAAEASEALLDIVAVGTVVDMVPLTRENRYLVYKGLQVLNKRERLGFQELLAQAGANESAPINSETLGFTIGPRLNALGRLERAEQGVELLTSSDPERIRVIAAHLEFLNRKRRELCDQTFLEADSHFQRVGGLAENRAIILGSPDWNPGIIGIVASRLIEKYHVPVFMMVIDEAKDIARCSARSIPDFHVHDQLLRLEDYFLNFGGHGGAAGFALKRDRLEAFKRDLHAICNSEITDEQMRPIVHVDARLEWGQLNPHLVALVDKMAPFGMDNPSPRFVIEPVQIASQRNIGESERHLKLVLAPGGKQRKSGDSTPPIDGLMWNVGSGYKLDGTAEYGFVVNPSLNTFNGMTKVQVIIEDSRVSGTDGKIVVDAGLAPKPKLVGAAKPTPVTALPIREKASVAIHNPAPDNDDDGHSADPGLQWIDHRNRDDLDSFIGQLMLPLRDGRSVLIYHEGRKPEIPFLDEKLLAGRFNLKPAQELILWDLPPSLGILEKTIAIVQPEVIHLVGGKARTVPIFQPERNYLTVMVQALRRLSLQSPEEPIVLSLDAFASQLATSEEVASHGLLLLEKLGMLSIRLVSPEEGTGNTSSVKVAIRVLSIETSLDMSERLEFALFQKAIRDVVHFRGWLLKSALATIKPVVIPTRPVMPANPESPEAVLAGQAS